MKKSFLNRTLKGTKIYMILILILSAIYSRLLVYIPMFIQYALDGVIMEKESIIPSLIRNLFYSSNKLSKIIVLVLVLIMVNILVFVVKYLKSKINTKFNLIINRNVKQTVLDHIPKISRESAKSSCNGRQRTRKAQLEVFPSRCPRIM